MTAFETYLLFQADSFRQLFSNISAISAVIAGISAVIWGAALSESTNDPEARQVAAKARYVSHRAAITFVLALSLLTVTPTSKTLAAMIVLPVITSNEFTNPVLRESKEILNLTKDALRALNPSKEPE